MIKSSPCEGAESSRWDKEHAGSSHRARSLREGLDVVPNPSRRQHPEVAGAGAGRRDRRVLLSITPRLKQLFLSEETSKQMTWHKDGKRDSEDSDIMSHPTDGDAWQTLDYFDPEFARD
jgi:hypothetical protein